MTLSASELRKPSHRKRHSTDPPPQPRENSMPELEKGKGRLDRVAKQTSEKQGEQPAKPEPKATSANPIVRGPLRRWEAFPDEGQEAEDALLVEKEEQDRLREGYGHSSAQDDDGAAVWRKARRSKQARWQAWDWIRGRLKWLLRRIQFRP